MKNKPENISKKDRDSVASPELSPELLSRMKPVKDNHPEITAGVHGPKKEPLKVPVSIRLSTDVVEFFKSQGKGWQTEINKILQEYMNAHN